MPVEFNEGQFRWRWRVERVGESWAVLRRKLLKHELVTIARVFPTQAAAQKFWETQRKRARGRYFLAILKRQAPRAEAGLWEGLPDEQDDFTVD